MIFLALFVSYRSMLSLLLLPLFLIMLLLLMLIFNEDFLMDCFLNFIFFVGYWFFIGKLSFNYLNWYLLNYYWYNY